VAKTLYATKWARPNTWLEQTGSPDEISQRHAHAAPDP
jgi:hypothetical protein